MTYEVDIRISWASFVHILGIEPRKPSGDNGALEASSASSSGLQRACYVASKLLKFMPERFRGEHLSRAEILCRVGSTTSHLQFLELLLFLLSNNLAEDMKKFDEELLRLLKRLPSLESLLRALYRSDLTSARAISEQIFHAAVRKLDSDLLAISLKAGADPNRPVPLGYILFPRTLSPDSYQADRTRLSASPLHIALYRQSMECSKQLIAFGADRSLDEDLGWSTICCAVAAFGWTHRTYDRGRPIRVNDLGCPATGFILVF